MRFIVCARDRQSGSVTLVAPSAFPNRREAVQAIISSPDIDAMLASDVFLIDLEVAVPVALVPVSDGVSAPDLRIDFEAEAEDESDDVEEAAAPAVEPVESAPVEPEPAPVEHETVPEPSFEDAEDTDTEENLESNEDNPVGNLDAVPENVRLDVLEIDIESWTCEDCIYVMTCEKSGALRPVECGSFQWRA